MLDELLKYHQEPESGDFTRQVMGELQKPDRSRSYILWGSGVIGCMFGIAGVVKLGGLPSQFVSAVTEQGPLGMPLVATIALLTLVGWAMNESLE